MGTVLKHIRNMGTQAEACGYGLRETDNTKCIPPSIKPSYKTKSQPLEGRADEKQVEKHPCYGCGLLGHKKVTCRFDKSVVLYCTYMHPYIYTVSRTTVQLLHRM